MFDPDEVITTYSLKQAIEDGLVEIFKNRWESLSGGKPIIATANLFEDVSPAALIEIWNEYVVRKKKIMPTLPQEERLFSTKMNQRGMGYRGRSGLHPDVSRGLLREALVARGARLSPGGRPPGVEAF